MSRGIVSSSNLQKLISILISLKSNVIIGTFADLITDNPLTSCYWSNLEANPSKKWVYLFIKLGTTQTKSISLLFDLRSNTWLPNGKTFAI